MASSEDREDRRYFLIVEMLFANAGVGERGYMPILLIIRMNAAQSWVWIQTNDPTLGSLGMEERVMKEKNKKCLFTSSVSAPSLNRT
jgi:hypothetical protein